MYVFLIVVYGGNLKTVFRDTANRAALGRREWPMDVTSSGHQRIKYTSEETGVFTMQLPGVLP